MKPLELRVYEIFKNKLGQQVAETVIEYIEVKAEQICENKMRLVATKDDIEQLKKATKDDIGELKKETKEDIGQLRKEMVEMKVEMKVQIVETKAEIIKWSFVFWIGTVIAVLGGLFGILKLFFNK